MERFGWSVTGIGIIALSVVMPLFDAPAARAQSAQLQPDPVKATEAAAEVPVTASEPNAAGEMVVTGERVHEAQQLQQSAEAVNVVDMRKAKEQSADLGEVLARTQGVSVRRDGGLGSTTRFSLNGLTDDQVRFFVDGVPLELAGYSFGVANVPVNLVERAEVYRGVVPIRLGADALGGVVNLVTNQTRGSYLGGSYQLGSFGIHRVTLDGRYSDEKTGFVLKPTAFLDLAKNDYSVRVQLPDARGRLSWANVPRFHDAYRAFGTTLEVGVVDRSWAKRLTLTGFASSRDKQLQHGTYMDEPYGEATYGETIYGATARYDVAVAARLKLEVTANYSHRVMAFRDMSEWRYGWRGRRLAMLFRAGEIGGEPSDSVLWQNAGFGRVLLIWEPWPEHTLRASVSPTYTMRTGHQRELSTPGERDPLSAKRALLTVVSGVEYEIDVLDDWISNVVFVKDYVYRTDVQEYPEGHAELRTNSTSHHSLGAGDSLRVRISPWFYLKASYEYATRLPRPDEVFGDGGTLQPNLKLKPEISHNANLGPRLELKRTPIGTLTVDVNAFLRESDRLIYVSGGASGTRYENLYKARALGVENGVSWFAPGRWLSMDGMLTWQDVRNESTEGDFADVKGDRLPNRPFLFGSWAARLYFDGLPTDNDSIELFYYGRYVHAFLVGWEGLGDRNERPFRLAPQLMHSVGVTWLVSRDAAHMTWTLELQNLTDARAFDNFGVQRPGRAFFAKLTANLP